MTKQRIDDFDDILDGISLGQKDDTPSNDELKKYKDEIDFLKKENTSLFNKLNTAFEANNVTGEAGKPLFVQIDDLIEDPINPNTRQEHNSNFEEWLTSNIKEQSESGQNGVQDPISVRWSEEHKKWIINKGHTRHRCAKKAGLKEVPIIIQDKSTDWNQVIENIIREGLPTKDMVAFIVRKKNEGISQTEIGKKLSRDKGWVSKHIALANLPTYIQSVWDNKYATDFIVLYTFLTVYKLDPEFVEEQANKIIAKKQSISKLDLLDIKKALVANKNNDEPENIDDEYNYTEDENSTGETTKKIKPILKISVEFDGQLAFLLIQEPSQSDHLVLELENGSKIEAKIDDVKIKGVLNVSDM